YLLRQHAPHLCNPHSLPTRRSSDLERAGRTDANANEVGSVGVGLCYRVENHTLDQTDNASRHGFRALLRRGWDRAHAVMLRTIFRHRAGNDVRSAQIDADDVAMSFLAGHAQWAEVGRRADGAVSACTTSATWRGVISRMQRQWPSGQ